MYLFFGLFFAICLFFIGIHFYRRRRIIRKIRCMDACQKLQIINDLTHPLGFRFLSREDIMTTQHHAWQRDFGYHTLYDFSAPCFHMIFDCEPVYFDYDNRTWRFEFWKGQYGITLGGEIGLYYADCVLAPEQYDTTLFQSVLDTELLPIAMEINYKGKCLFQVKQRHWWLTGFRIGQYCEPEDLTMKASITFPCEEMRDSFVESMLRLGYHSFEVNVRLLTVSFCFSSPHTSQPRKRRRFMSKMAQFWNRTYVKLYLCVTRPFLRTEDRILYLYYYLPALLRRMLRFKRNRRQKCHWKKRHSYEL